MVVCSAGAHHAKPSVGGHPLEAGDRFGGGVDTVGRVGRTAKVTHPRLTNFVHAAPNLGGDGGLGQPAELQLHDSVALLVGQHQLLPTKSCSRLVDSATGIDPVASCHRLQITST